MSFFSGIKDRAFSSRKRSIITITIIIICLVILSLGVTTVYFVMHGGKDQSENQQFDLSAANAACPINKSAFSQFIIPIQNVTTITPLGHLDPPSHNFPVPHMYVNMATNSQGISPKLAVVAPSNIVVNDISIIAKADDSINGKTYYDYKIWFSACDGALQGYLIHIYSLSPILESAFGQINQSLIQKNITGHESWGPGISVTDTGYSKFMNVQVSSGADLGTVGGIEGMSTNIDFGLSDLRVNQNIADPSIWTQGNDNHYVCSLMYFPQSIENQLYAKLGDFNGQPVGKSDDECGSVYQDNIGTAQGVWLTKGTNTKDQTVWSLNPYVVSFVQDNINTNMEMMGFSSDIEQVLGFDDTQAYIFTPNTISNINPYFSNVTPNGQIYCFQTSPQYASPGQSGITFLLEMLDKNTLRFGTLKSQNCNSSPWQFYKYIDLNR